MVLFRSFSLRFCGQNLALEPSRKLGTKDTSRIPKLGRRAVAYYFTKGPRPLAASTGQRKKLRWARDAKQPTAGRAV